MGGGGVRIDLKGLSIFADGPVELAPIQQRITQFGVSHCYVWGFFIDLDRLIILVHAPSRPAGDTSAARADPAALPRCPLVPCGRRAETRVRLRRNW